MIFSRIDVLRCYETVRFCQTAWHHNLEDGTLQRKCIRYVCFIYFLFCMREVTVLITLWNIMAPVCTTCFSFQERRRLYLCGSMILNFLTGWPLEWKGNLFSIKSKQNFWNWKWFRLFALPFDHGERQYTMRTTSIVKENASNVMIG